MGLPGLEESEASPADHQLPNLSAMDGALARKFLWNFPEFWAAARRWDLRLPGTCWQDGNMTVTGRSRQTSDDWSTCSPSLAGPLLSQRKSVNPRSNSTLLFRRERYLTARLHRRAGRVRFWKIRRGGLL